jgi:hypothetical protein
MIDNKAEIEYQRCNLALGKVVDVPLLLDIADKAILDAEKAEEKLEQFREDCGNAAEDRAFRFLCEAVNEAVVSLRKARVDVRGRNKIADALAEAIRKGQEIIEGDE